MTEKHAVIYDGGATLTISATGTLTVTSDSTLVDLFTIEDYSTSVTCYPSDTVWM